jgi:hypothetical protein
MCAALCITFTATCPAESASASTGADMEAEPRRWGFERTIRNLLGYPKKPAIVVFMVHPHKDTYWQTAETDMLVISQHYQLPVISTRCARSCRCISQDLIIFGKV